MIMTDAVFFFLVIYINFGDQQIVKRDILCFIYLQTITFAAVVNSLSSVIRKSDLSHI